MLGTPYVRILYGKLQTEYGVNPFLIVELLGRLSCPWLPSSEEGLTTMYRHVLILHAIVFIPSFENLHVRN